MKKNESLFCAINKIADEKSKAHVYFMNRLRFLNKLGPRIAASVTLSDAL